MNLKRRIKSERGTSSESWRRLVVKQLNKIPELRIFFEKELICIYQLIIIHDTERNRENMMQFISSGNIKSLLGMQGKFPHDYDKVDYPGLNLLLLKS